MKHLWRILALSLALIPLGPLLYPNAQITAVGQNTLGHIRGAVLDNNEARILETTVAIEGNGLKREVTVNEFGEYEFHIPPGVYFLKAQAPNWYEFRRAPVRVMAGKEIVINITPTIRILSSWYELKEEGSKEQVKIASSPQYDTYGQLIPTEPELSLLVQYKKKQTEKGSLEYQEVVVSYNTLTVRADILRVTNPILKLRVYGNVIVDIGGQRIHTDQVEIDLKSRVVILSVPF
jgi:hypothetical protein